MSDELCGKVFGTVNGIDLKCEAPAGHDESPVVAFRKHHAVAGTLTLTTPVVPPAPSSSVSVAPEAADEIETRLGEIEGELADVFFQGPRGWWWTRNYELSSDPDVLEKHWALTNAESEAEGKVVSGWLVLATTASHDYDGRPLDETRHLRLIAHAPEHLDWALSQIRALRSRLTAAETELKGVPLTDAQREQLRGHPEVEAAWGNLAQQMPTGAFSRLGLEAALAHLVSTYVNIAWRAEKSDFRARLAAAEAETARLKDAARDVVFTFSDWRENPTLGEVGAAERDRALNALAELVSVIDAAQAEDSQQLTSRSSLRESAP